MLPAATEDRPHPEYDFNIVIGKFDEHFVPKRNVIHERACFHKRSQRAGETVEAFVLSLCELAQHCEFGAGKDEQIRNRIVIGIMNKDVSQRAKAKSTPNVIEESGSDTEWDVELQVNGSPVDFKINTGADTTVMTEMTFNKLKQRPKLDKTRSTVYSPGGKVRCVSKFLATTTYKSQKYQYWITVIKGQYASNLLRAKRMGLVTRVNAICGDLANSVFGEIGLLNCEPVKIELTEDAVPYSVNMPRRVPFPLLPKVEKQIKRMLSLGIIEEVTEPTDWCAPMVPAPKRNKEEVRVCVDLKRLNKGAKPERYILLTLDDITPKLSGALYSRCLQRVLANSIGLQLPKTDHMYHPNGTVFCFKQIFQRLMSNLLKGLDGTVVVMDDILVFGSTKEEHDRRLDAVQQTVKASDLKLN